MLERVLHPRPLAEAEKPNPRSLVLTPGEFDMPSAPERQALTSYISCLSQILPS